MSVVLGEYKSTVPISLITQKEITEEHHQKYLI